MRVWLSAASLLVTTVACGGFEVGTTELVVSAASSLTDVFSQIEAEFEIANPGVDVVLNVGGSSLLREQILGGAPVDVFASANPEVMNAVSEAGLIQGEARVFALNRLEIAVPAGNPGRVGGLEDFGDDALLIGLCAPEVPCGEYAREVLAAAGINSSIDSEEPNVRALLLKLQAAELDAGIVYESDIQSNDLVEGIAIPDGLNVSTSYVIAPLTSSSSLEKAGEFVAFVLSPIGRAILGDYGFELP